MNNGAPVNTRVAKVLALFAASMILAACGNSAATGQTTTTAATLTSGVYESGAAGTPHYFVVLTAKVDGTVTGSVQFIFQDGQTASVLPFTGIAQSGVATLTPGPIPTVTQTSVGAQNVPSSLSMTYTSNAIQLGECAGYLPSVPNEPSCTFHLSRT